MDEPLFDLGVLLSHHFLEEIFPKLIEFKIEPIVLSYHFYCAGFDLWTGLRNFAVFIERDLPVKAFRNDHKTFFESLAKSQLR